MLELELQPWYDTTTVVDDDDVVESRWVGCVGWLWTWRGSESIDDRVRELRSSLCSVSLSRVRVCVCGSIYLYRSLHDRPTIQSSRTHHTTALDRYLCIQDHRRSFDRDITRLAHSHRSINLSRALSCSIDRPMASTSTNERFVVVGLDLTNQPDSYQLLFCVGGTFTFYLLNGYLQEAIFRYRSTSIPTHATLSLSLSTH